MCVYMYAIHSQVYRICGPEIWFIGNPIPKDVYLEANYFNTTFEKGSHKGICWLTKNEYLFVCNYRVIESEIVIIIGYNFRSLYHYI